MLGDIPSKLLPNRLERIALDFISNNLTRTVCRSNEENGLELKDGINLPPVITDQILQHLVNSLNLDPLQNEEVSEKLIRYCKIFMDVRKCNLRRIVINRAAISDDMVQMLVDLCEVHNLLEIDLSNSSDMNGDDNDFTPPYNHAILLPGLILSCCGKTLQKFTMSHTFLAYSINQILMFSGKKAKTLKQDIYLTSYAKVENLPICMSSASTPNLTTLDISETLTGWFLTIDPTCPPPLKVLNVSGYPEIRVPSTIKKILKQLVYGEKDFEIVAGKRRATVAHSKSKRKLQKYKFFEKILPHQSIVDEFLKASGLEKSLSGEDKTPDEFGAAAEYNFIVRQMNVLSLKDTLRHLSLYNTWLSLSDFEDVIFQLKNLHHLDVGWPTKQLNKSDKYRPNKITIWRMLNELPILTSLDVSGTFYGEKLYEDAQISEGETEKSLQMDRKREPLSFLGLWATKSCKLKGMDDLALKVSGDSTEGQLLTCLDIYVDRPEIVSDVLTKLSNLQQESACDRPNMALKLILRCVYHYPTSGNLLFTCAANIYYLLRLQSSILTIYQKRDIVKAVTMMMERNLSNQMLVRNCMIIYFNLDLPHDVLFDFDHIAELVLSIFDKQRDVAEVNVIAGNLCNALICSMEVDVKTEIRKLNYVGVMTNIIRSRLKTGNGDEVLDTAWSALWNATDETAANSEDFIAMDGLDLFHQCYAKFQGHNDLVRNMMGLIGNIAEVRHLRPNLAKRVTLELIIYLVSGTDSGTEVAYNACGTLSNLLIDDSDILKGVNLSSIRSQMQTAILSWDVDVARNINYRTFEPLFAVLRCPKEPVTHLWVTWAILNLCCREPKYVQLVIKGGGVGLIKSVRDTTNDESTKQFASEIARKCDHEEGSPV